MTAFPEPARTLWTAYADSRRRPRRAHALEAEHGEAKLRLVAAPPIVAPERESGDAYIRRSQDMVYVCPWETRLRSWLAFARFREETPSRLAGTYVPAPVAHQVEEAFERWKQAGRGTRPHIRTSNWHVPLSWFVPFAASERCLMLGPPPPAAPQGGEPIGRGPVTASATRTLMYVTSMREARSRIDAALPAVRDHLDHDSGLAAGRIETLAHWLAEFHHEALVELDYGGLVHLLDDRTLSTDESVAEVGVALTAMTRGEVELCVAMYKRLLARWRPVRALRSAN
ncbi:hypothetical protein [Actinomadura sp. 9N407]|uniref:hypothetical protein n=1 Tax=Actinomadura sp. 9N407 TaxID=3375154 RepID=UPI0037B78E9F